MLRRNREAVPEAAVEVSEPVSPIVSKSRPERSFWRTMAYITYAGGLVITAVLVGAEQINENGIQPGLEREGDRLERVVDSRLAPIAGISSKDIDTLIAVACNLNAQLPSTEASSSGRLDELCQEHIPTPEAEPAQPVPMDTQAETAQIPPTTIDS